MLVGSLLTKEQLTGWLYTANAATVSKRPAFANLSAWRIASRPNPQTKQQGDASSWLVSGELLIWMYTANAATASKKASKNALSDNKCIDNCPQCDIMQKPRK